MSRSERRRARPLAGAICAAAMLLAGCATPASPPAPADEVRSWAGRFAVTWTPAAPPPRQESASGRFSLREAGDRTELEVFSPFGQTVARALARPGTAVLETADGRRFEAPDPEALTESVLGWRAPVQMLPAWLRGNGADRLVESGWDVQVDARDNGRPQRLTLSWPAGITPSPPARPRVTIRLLLDPAEGAAAPDGTR
ncbi:MAG TPA: outer membrane lipoprotein LolB [Quisquiliibacterium sp.]|jgi:outer membrane lipoprotein LolB|nr:outer membrane lipoprotein LolB [Quisquiliibacterium sp.]